MVQARGLGAWSRRAGATFPDIEKAFDRVWHNGLHYELLHINAPALVPRWISSFLRDMTVKVRILGHTSREIAINYGVPQGSPISPILFLHYMSKISELLPTTRRSLFADNFMIYSESSIAISDLIQSNLQTSMDDLAIFNASYNITVRSPHLLHLLSSFDSSLCSHGAPATCVASPNVQRSWDRIQTHFISRALSIPPFIHNDRKRLSRRKYPRKRLLIGKYPRKRVARHHARMYSLYAGM